MTPKEKAEDLVNQFKNILMDEDTECGNEILCTLIAINYGLCNRSCGITDRKF